MSVQPTQWDDFQTEHFLLRSAPDSFVARNITTVATRLESVYATVMAKLELSAGPTQIVVWFTPSTYGEVMPAPIVEIEPQPSMTTSYEPDAPAPNLERSLVFLLLGVESNQPSARCPMLVDGLLDHLAQPGKADHQVAGLRRAGQRIAVAEMLPGPGAGPNYYPVAGSFTGFLLTRFGPDAFRRFAAQLVPDDPDVAAELIFRKPLAVLEMEWLDSLRAIKPAPLTIFQFVRLALGHLRQHWPMVAALMFSVLFTLADPLIRPFLMRSILDKAVMGRDSRLLAALVAGLVGLLAFQSLANLLREYLSARLTAVVISELPLRLFRHLQRLSVQYYNQSRVSELSGRLSGELADLEIGLSTVLVQGSGLVLTVTIGLGLLAWVEWRLTLISTVCLGLVFLGPYLIRPKADAAKSKRNKAMRAADRIVVEHLSAIPLIRTFGMEQATAKRYGDLVAEHARSTVRYGFFRGLESTSIQMGGALVQVIVFVVGAYFALAGSLTVGSLYLFTALFGRSVVAAFMQIARIAKPMRDGASSMQFIQELLDEPESTVDDPAAVPLVAPAREIRFSNVTFSYTGDQINLRDVNLTVPVGQTLAVVGPSGSGKTTLLNLLLRLYDPNVGSVSIDDHSLRALTQVSLRQGMAAVLQDVSLINSTIGENIRVGKPGADLAEVQAVARLAEIHDFIESLPKGYDTEVGTGGARLSGGQRQRIALARAMLRDPYILVCDEATSALDPQTEAAIIATLQSLARHRTIIHSTHRLEIAAGCDRIVVLDRGQVVEYGTHKELMALNGLYVKLWKHQHSFSTGTGAEPISPEISLLRSVPLFSRVGAEVLSRMSQRFATEEFQPGDLVFNQGDPGDKFYLLVYGTMDVILSMGDAERRLATLRDGDYFGEMALLHDVPRTATIRARGPSKVLTLDQASFNNLLHLAPSLRTSIEEVIAARKLQNAATVKK